MNREDKVKTPDLRKLQHALTLAKTGSFLKASEQLHLTQSALSRSIQVLEADCGLLLFDRLKSGVTPTTEGIHILQRAEKLLLHARSLDKDIALLKNIESGQISLGVGPAMPAIFLNELLVFLAEQYPGLDARVDIESSTTLLRLLLDETIEFFVADVEGIDITEQSVVIEPIATMSIGCYVNRDHPLASASNISIEQINSYSLISPQRKIDTRTPNSIVGKQQLLCNDITTLKSVTLNTFAIMLALDRSVSKETQSKELVKLQLEPSLTLRSSTTSIVRIRDRSLSRAATAITGKIKQLI